MVHCHRPRACIIIISLFAIYTSNASDGDNIPERGRKQSKVISVSLDSNWNDTSIVAEVSEFLWDEDPNLFWSFIGLVHNQLGNDVLNKMDVPGQYEAAIRLASTLLSSQSRFSLLKFGLSLRIHSPKIAMFDQISLDRLASSTHQCSDAKAFVEVSSTGSNPSILCDTKLLQHHLSKLISGCELSHPKIFKPDHVLSHTADPCLTTVVLHGAIGSADFWKFHSMMSDLSILGNIKYAMRHYYSLKSNVYSSLSGYGVELAIKSTEYRAVDDTRVKGEESSLTKILEENETIEIEEVAGFRIKDLKEKFPNKVNELNELTDHLTRDRKEIVNLKVWELQKLSLQTLSKVLSAPKSDQLKLFEDIVQNFPTHAKTLSQVKVDKDVQKEVERTQMILSQTINLSPSDTALFIDGMFFDLDVIDIFTLFDHLKKEVKLVEGLHRVVSDEEQVKKLLNLDISNEKPDQLAVDIRDSAIIYINDIENDNMYKSWPSSISDMLRPTYPGMLRNVRKNMYNLVLIIDPSKKETHELIKLCESFYVHKAPLRIGLVFITPNTETTGLEDPSIAILNAFNYISQELSAFDGLSFLTEVIASVGATDIQSKDVVRHFKSKYPKVSVDLVFGADSDFNTGIQLTEDFLERTGLGTATRVLLNGVILSEGSLSGDSFEEAVLTEIMRQTPIIQKAVYSKELTDKDDILDWLMKQNNVMPRLNKQILNTEDAQFLDMTSPGDSIGYDMNSSTHPELVSSIISQANYLVNSNEKCHPITVWIFTDLTTNQGKVLVRDAIEHMRTDSESVRLAVIHSSVSDVAIVFEGLLRTIDDQKQLQNLLIKVLESEDQNLSTLINLLPTDVGIDIKSSQSEVQSLLKLHEMCHLKCSSSLLHDSIVINGRVVRMESSTFTQEDFNLIEKHGMITHGNKLKESVSKSQDVRSCSDQMMKIASLLLSKPGGKQRHDLNLPKGLKSIITIEPNDPSSSALDVVAVFEPLSRGAQKILPLLNVLKQVVNMNIKIYSNCIDKHSEMPLKSFFRFVLEPELLFTDQGIRTNNALFQEVPSTALFTLGMVTPENWLVECIKSPHDLDNIHLEQVQGSGVFAIFKLQNLLLEGHCFEQSTGNPPRGLQLVLTSKVSEEGHYKDVIGDTIVMANLGYFQLKANPGAWHLALRSGRSSDIYTIVKSDGEDIISPGNSTPSVPVLITSFRSNVVKVKVSKKPGKADQELLFDGDADDDGANVGFWNDIWGGKKDTDLETGNGSSDIINIFSLASGHLYERLLRIMMLSVMKHTKSPIKFWFLKNYLSPTFKESLPKMATAYKFEYELVEYKWPRWLHQQTEKQRIIWGYKILFLDVLFPLSVCLSKW